MKNWIRTTLITLFSFSLLTGALAGCSREHHANWNAEDSARVQDKIAEKLDLDATQKQKLTVLGDQLLALRKGVKGDSQDPRTEFSTLISGATFDRSGAQTLLDEKTKALQSEGPQVITAMADFYDSLNPEQQSEIREKLQRRKGWFGH